MRPWATVSCQARPVVVRRLSTAFESGEVQGEGDTVPHAMRRLSGLISIGMTRRVVPERQQLEMEVRCRNEQPKW